MYDICGIDEAGRGALAGPLVIAACVLHKDIPGINDSKKLTPTKRKKLFADIVRNSKFMIVYFSNLQVDDFGLSECIKRALYTFKRYFSEYKLIFDGNTDYQVGIQTIIKADEKISSVGAASILAKVSRDTMMELFDGLYPQYGYKNHKGYGTKEHINAIKTYGFCPLSRVSFNIKSKI